MAYPPPSQGQYPPQHCGYPQQQPLPQGGFPPQQQQQGSYPPPPQQAPPPIQDMRPFPPGWISQWDANSNRLYFVDQSTGRTAWEDPRGPMPPFGGYAPPPGAPMQMNKALDGYPGQHQPAFYPPQQQPAYPTHHQQGYPPQEYGAPLSYVAPPMPMGQMAAPNAHPYHAPLNAEHAKSEAFALKKATAGLGTDEKEIIRIISTKSPTQLQQISQAFQAEFKKDLRKVLKSEDGGQFGELCEDMFTFVPGEMEACALRKAMAGVGTNELSLITHLCGKSTGELLAIKDSYKKFVKRDLMTDLKEELSGDLEYFFTTLMRGRPEMETQGVILSVDDDVKALYKAGAGKIGTDEKAIIDIMLQRTTSHLKKVFDAYSSKYKPIETMIKSEISGNTQIAILATISSIKNRALFIASQYEAALVAVPLVNHSLLRQMTVKYRGPEYMKDVKAAYVKEYHASLVSKIQAVTSGDYQKLMLAILEQF